MQEEKQHYSPMLSLQVINGNNLESGRAAKCQFTTEGGDIGDHDNCHWIVQDRQNSVQACACSVIWHDGAFCLRNQTPGLCINQAQVETDTGLVRLRHGDEVQLGSLTLKAFLHQGQTISYDERMATPETIVMNRDALADTLLTTQGQPEYPGMPFQHQMGSTVAHGFSSDPLQVLQPESLTTGAVGYHSTDSISPTLTSTSQGRIDSTFMDLPPIYAQGQDDNDEFSHMEMSHRHLALTPLMRGLSCSLTIQNSQEADDFLEESGRALQAAIKGLLNLQQQQNSLSDKHLRPLEDNPLRLDLDYITALSVMFAEGKSPVHLAAPAAIAESLRNIEHHEQANKTAITEALRVMLEAFSPDNLMRRFVQYRRSHELRQPLNDAGAWQMYSHYYDELASDRQQGFEMLFNEVYAQVYDRTLREKQRESGA